MSFHPGKTTQLPLSCSFLDFSPDDDSFEPSATCSTGPNSQSLIPNGSQYIYHTSLDPCTSPLLSPSGSPKDNFAKNSSAWSSLARSSNYSVTNSKSSNLRSLYDRPLEHSASRRPPLPDISHDNKFCSLTVLSGSRTHGSSPPTSTKTSGSAISEATSVRSPYIPLQPLRSLGKSAGSSTRFEASDIRNSISSDGSFHSLVSGGPFGWAPNTCGVEEDHLSTPISPDLSTPAQPRVVASQIRRIDLDTKDKASNFGSKLPREIFGSISHDKKENHEEFTKKIAPLSTRSFISFSEASNSVCEFEPESLRSLVASSILKEYQPESKFDRGGGAITFCSDGRIKKKEPQFLGIPEISPLDSRKRAQKVEARWTKECANHTLVMKWLTESAA